MAAPNATPIDELFAEIDQAEAQARRLTDGLSEAQLVWSPEPTRWSIAHCLGHLNMTGDFYLGSMEKAMAKAPELSGPPVPSKPGWFERKFIAFIKPGSTFKGPAPKSVVPRIEGSPRKIVEEFLTLQDRYRRALQTAKTVDINRAKFFSPLARFLRLRVGAGLEINLHHQHRHLAQAQRVLEDEGFPKA